MTANSEAKLKVWTRSKQSPGELGERGWGRWLHYNALLALVELYLHHWCT